MKLIELFSQYFIFNFWTNSGDNFEVFDKIYRQNESHSFLGPQGLECSHNKERKVVKCERFHPCNSVKVDSQFRVGFHELKTALNVSKTKNSSYVFRHSTRQLNGS